MGPPPFSQNRPPRGGDRPRPRLGLAFDAEVVEWRGPAPYLFAVMPERQVADLAPLAHDLTYGWGCIPATVSLGHTTFNTALFPRGGSYLVPIKIAVQRAEGVGLGDTIHLELTVGS